jgi:hypothetical protein
MTTSDDLGRWAAAFVRQYELESGKTLSPQPTADQPPAGPQKYPSLTLEASLLLESVDAGGVPAFITQNLLRIARDNGLEVGGDATPNDVVAALRRLAA